MIHPLWLACCFAAAASILCAGPVRADAIDTHPAGDQLKRIFAAPVPADFKPTGITRANYLPLIAANIDFFKKCQDATGAIIDPVSKGERQYSTPAYAVAAGLLVKEAGRKDLLESASTAMSCSITALVEKRPADKHADFYIPLLVHAYRSLKDVAAPEQVKTWQEQFKRIDPETMYRADLRGMNWNIVSSSGELLRRRDGLVADDRLDAQMKYLESCLDGHMDRFTPIGLFEDPGSPMTYDAFSRLWLEDVYADDAYHGRHEEDIRNFLIKGGLSTLLLLSPTGEWAPGGRSGLHNWADAQIATICEINAVHWKKAGRDDVAGAFKRAAHLAFQSVARWQRPTGELWIIKNRAEPDTRFAYESYSNHSQYNLLPMAMLAIAYTRADDAVVERPSPSETGGYVFDARPIFHKVAAAAGGYYVLVDTAGDPHYNATGLQRVHKAGVLFPALSDSAAPDRAYGVNQSPKAAIAPGIQWKGPQDAWLGLASFSGEKAKLLVKSAELATRSTESSRSAFDVTYALTGADDKDRTVTERYLLTPEGVELTSTVAGESAAFGVTLPVLVSDGAADTDVKLTSNAVAISHLGSVTTMELPADVETLALQGPRIVTHNGFMQAAFAGVKTNAVTIKIELKEESTKPK